MQNFSPETAALVVIDLQKGIMAMNTAPHSPTQILEKATRLAEAFRKAGAPVFLVNVTPSADGRDRLAPTTDKAGPLPPNSSDWSELVIASEPSDFRITKRQWGAFHGTELDLQMRRRGIRTIVLCGISTNIGVESTARAAFELGYDQILVEDACSASSAEEHELSFVRIFPRIARVRSTEEVLAEFR